MTSREILIDCYWELEAIAKAHNLSIPEYVVWYQAEQSHDRQVQRLQNEARSALRNGVGQDLDLNNVDLEYLRERLNLAPGRQTKNFLKAEVKHLKQIRDLRGGEVITAAYHPTHQEE
jgi:hypothetical protein